MSVMTENTPGWVWRPVALRQQRPDGLDYEPVIRSGHYLAGQEGFEPSTIRLTAERTTAVLLTPNEKRPRNSAALNALWFCLN